MDRYRRHNDHKAKRSRDDDSPTCSPSGSSSSDSIPKCYRRRGSQDRKGRKRSPSSDRERSRKEKRRKTSEPMTLGELVEKAAGSKRSSERAKREGQHESRQATTSRPPSPEQPSDRKHNEDMPYMQDDDLNEVIVMNPDEPFNPETMKIQSRPISARTIPSTYLRVDGCVFSSFTERVTLSNFEQKVLGYTGQARASQPECPLLPPPPTHASCKCGKDDEGNDSDSSSSSSSEDESDGRPRKSSRARNNEHLLNEIQRKQRHPAALDPSLIFNEPGLTNDGPACRCPKSARSEGIRHQVFMGEDFVPPCNPNSNNADRLHHYVLTVSNANSSTQKSSTITVGQDVFTFRGFSVFFHRPLPEVFPKMPISRWNTEIDFEFIQEPVPENFTVGELEAFTTYLLDNVLELYDFPRFPGHVQGGGCPIFHVMPRYTAYLDGKLQMLAPMSAVLDYLTSQFGPILNPVEAVDKMSCPEEQWTRYSGHLKHTLVVNPFMRPSTLRVDSVGRSQGERYPTVYHHTSRCPAYLSVHLAEVQSQQKKLNKMKKTAKMKKAPSHTELREIEQMQRKIDSRKNEISKLRPLTVAMSAERYYKTGFAADVVTHCLTLSLACFHARLHLSFEALEDQIEYKFKNRALLELALIHPSFKQNYGLNSDHARNTLLTCGHRNLIRPEKLEDIRRLGGYPRIAETLRGGDLRVKTYQVVHNERLEYLGDAVVEMIVTNHLFLMLPNHQEGGLATYRSALVQNRNLASLAQNMGLQHFLLFTDGPDLCHENDFRHALANAFEAVMGAIYLDQGLDESDRIFSDAMWASDLAAKAKWDHMSDHELVAESPEGDRGEIEAIECLKMLTGLEENIGYQFRHIKLLAKAMTRRCIPFNYITRGHNQRLEWLGDTVLQLIVSDYLYRHFPYHNEGHLSQLRTCIVSNKTQSIICEELCLHNYCIKPTKRADNSTLKMKDKADLVESLIGAIFVDGGLPYCERFVRILFLPRLRHFLVEKRWSDDKSKLQQACLAFRSGHKSECPVYRTLSQSGPTNSRVYTVGVFFRNKKLAEGTASNLHNAAMEAAKNGLKSVRHLLLQSDTQESASSSRSTPSSRSGQSYTPGTDSSQSIPSLMSLPPSAPPQMSPLCYIPVSPGGIAYYPGLVPGQPTALMSQPPPPSPLIPGLTQQAYQSRK